MNTCEHCRHWDREDTHGLTGRREIHHNTKPEDLLDRVCLHPDPRMYIEGPCYYGAIIATDPSFGCVHWEPKGLQV